MPASNSNAVVDGGCNEFASSGHGNCDSMPALFHIGFELPADTERLQSLFHDVKVVLMCGTRSRAELICREVLASSNTQEQHDNQSTTTADHDALKPIGSTERYVILRPTPHVLVAAHGIGIGSIDTLLHEITTMLRIANASDFKYIRIGSCGGCGIPAGSVVLSTNLVNGAGNPELVMNILGTTIKVPAKLDHQLTNQLYELASNLYGTKLLRTGTTMCCDTFYVGQARLDGAFADLDKSKQQQMLRKCQEMGVVNFEMESLALGAFCSRAGIPSAVMCVVLVDRVGSGADSPTASASEIREWELRPVRVATQYAVRTTTAKI